MTMPSATVLDAINEAAAAYVILDGAYPYGSAPGVAQKLDAAQNRAAIAFAAIAEHHGESVEDLANACRSRPNFSGGIDC